MVEKMKVMEMIYNKNNTNTNLHCPFSCLNCTDFDNCTSCKNGLNPIKGRRPTCLEIYHGCDEDCNKDGCNKCLKLLQSKKFDTVECDNNKIQSPLSFDS